MIVWTRSVTMNWLLQMEIYNKSEERAKRILQKQLVKLHALCIFILGMGRDVHVLLLCMRFNIFFDIQIVCTLFDKN